MVFRDILTALCEMFSITCSMSHGHTAWPPCSPDMSLVNFRVCSSCWQRRGTTPSHCVCMSDYQQPPPAFLNGCDSPWWDVSRRALNLVEDILSTLWICAFGYNSQMKCFRTHVSMYIFSCSAIQNLYSNLSAPFSYILYKVKVKLSLCLTN
jgi:hypothetical protein